MQWTQKWLSVVCQILQECGDTVYWTFASFYLFSKFQPLPCARFYRSRHDPAQPSYADAITHWAELQSSCCQMPIWSSFFSLPIELSQHPSPFRSVLTFIAHWAKVYHLLPPIALSCFPSIFHQTCTICRCLLSWAIFLAFHRSFHYLLLWRLLPIWWAHPNVLLQMWSSLVPWSIHTFLPNTPLFDQLEFAYMNTKYDYLSCWSSDILSNNSNLLKMKESPVPMTLWIWPSPPVLQQTATCQAPIVFCLHPESYKHVKCCLRPKFQASYHFHKSYSYCL